MPSKDAASLAEGERSALSKSEKMKGLTERYGTNKAIRQVRDCFSLRLLVCARQVCWKFPVQGSVELHKVLVLIDC